MFLFQNKKTRKSVVGPEISRNATQNSDFRPKDDFYTGILSDLDVFDIRKILN